MIVAACLVAVVVGTVAGAALSAWSTRRRLSTTPARFRCVLAPEPSAGAGLSRPRWSRSVSHACWVHDVLLVSSGRLGTTVRAVGVHFVEGPLDDPTVPRGLGKKPVVLGLQPAPDDLDLRADRAHANRSRSGTSTTSRDMGPPYGPPSGVATSTGPPPDLHRRRGRCPHRSQPAVADQEVR